MTLPISGISPIVPGAAAPGAVSTPASSSAQGASNGFLNMLNQVSSLESDANTKAVQLATGQLSDIHQFTIASAKAQLAVETAAAVRNRAVDAFSEIMRMQI